MKKDLLKNNPAIGMSWEEFEKEYFTPEEIAASDLRVAIIGELIKARREKAVFCPRRKAARGAYGAIVAPVYAPFLIFGKIAAFYGAVCGALQPRQRTECGRILGAQARQGRFRLRDKPFYGGRLWR